MLRWWLEHKMPYSADQMEAAFRQLALPGAREVLGDLQEQ
jgi:hypothetical protein